MKSLVAIFSSLLSLLLLVLVLAAAVAPRAVFATRGDLQKDKLVHVTCTETLGDVDSSSLRSIPLTKRTTLFIDLKDSCTSVDLGNFALDRIIFSGTSFLKKSQIKALALHNIACTGRNTSYENAAYKAPAETPPPGDLGHSCLTFLGPITVSGLVVNLKNIAMDFNNFDGDEEFAPEFPAPLPSNPKPLPSSTVALVRTVALVEAVELFRVSGCRLRYTSRNSTVHPTISLVVLGRQGSSAGSLARFKANGNGRPVGVEVTSSQLHVHAASSGFPPGAANKRIAPPPQAVCFLCVLSAVNTARRIFLGEDNILNVTLFDEQAALNEIIGYQPPPAERVPKAITQVSGAIFSAGITVTSLTVTQTAVLVLSWPRPTYPDWNLSPSVASLHRDGVFDGWRSAQTSDRLVRTLRLQNINFNVTIAGLGGKNSSSGAAEAGSRCAASIFSAAQVRNVMRVSVESSDIVTVNCNSVRLLHLSRASIVRNAEVLSVREISLRFYFSDADLGAKVIAKVVKIVTLDSVGSIRFEKIFVSSFTRKEIAQIAPVLAGGGGGSSDTGIVAKRFDSRAIHIDQIINVAAVFLAREISSTWHVPLTQLAPGAMRVSCVAVPRLLQFAQQGASSGIVLQNLNLSAAGDVVGLNSPAVLCAVVLGNVSSSLLASGITVNIVGKVTSPLLDIAAVLFQRALVAENSSSSLVFIGLHIFVGSATTPGSSSVSGIYAVEMASNSQLWPVEGFQKFLVTSSSVRVGELRSVLYCATYIVYLNALNLVDVGQIVIRHSNVTVQRASSTKYLSPGACWLSTDSTRATAEPHTTALKIVNVGEINVAYNRVRLGGTVEISDWLGVYVFGLALRIVTLRRAVIRFNIATVERVECPNLQLFGAQFLMAEDTAANDGIGTVHVADNTLSAAAVVVEAAELVYFNMVYFLTSVLGVNHILVAENVVSVAFSPSSSSGATTEAALMVKALMASTGPRTHGIFPIEIAQLTLRHNSILVDARPLRSQYSSLEIAILNSTCSPQSLSVVENEIRFLATPIFKGCIDAGARGNRFVTTIIQLVGLYQSAAQKNTHGDVSVLLVGNKIEIEQKEKLQICLFAVLINIDSFSLPTTSRGTITLANSTIRAENILFAAVWLWKLEHTNLGSSIDFSNAFFSIDGNRVPPSSGAGHRAQAVLAKAGITHVVWSERGKSPLRHRRSEVNLGNFDIGCNNTFGAAALRQLLRFAPVAGSIKIDPSCRAELLSSSVSLSGTRSSTADGGNSSSSRERTASARTASRTASESAATEPQTETASGRSASASRTATAASLSESASRPPPPKPAKPEREPPLFAGAKGLLIIGGALASPTAYQLSRKALALITMAQCPSEGGEIEPLSIDTNPTMMMIYSGGGAAETTASGAGDKNNNNLLASYRGSIVGNTILTCGLYCVGLGVAVFVANKKRCKFAEAQGETSFPGWVYLLLEVLGPAASTAIGTLASLGLRDSGSGAKMAVVAAAGTVDIALIVLGVIIFFVVPARVQVKINLGVRLPMEVLEDVEDFGAHSCSGPALKAREDAVKSKRNLQTQLQSQDFRDDDDAEAEAEENEHAQPLLSAAAAKRAAARKPSRSRRTVAVDAATISSCSNRVRRLWNYLMEQWREWKETELSRQYGVIYDATKTPLFAAIDYHTAFGIGLLAGIAVNCPALSCCQAVVVTAAVLATAHICFVLGVRPFLSRFEVFFNTVASLITFGEAVLVTVVIFGAEIDMSILMILPMFAQAFGVATLAFVFLPIVFISLVKVRRWWSNLGRRAGSAPGAGGGRAASPPARGKAAKKRKAKNVGGKPPSPSAAGSPVSLSQFDEEMRTPRTQQQQQQQQQKKPKPPPKRKFLTKKSVPSETPSHPAGLLATPPSAVAAAEENENEKQQEQDQEEAVGTTGVFAAAAAASPSMDNRGDKEPKEKNRESDEITSSASASAAARLRLLDEVENDAEVKREKNDDDGDDDAGGLVPAGLPAAAAAAVDDFPPPLRPSLDISSPLFELQMAPDAFSDADAEQEGEEEEEEGLFGEGEEYFEMEEMSSEEIRRLLGYDE